MIRPVVANERLGTAADIHEAYVKAEVDLETARRSLDYLSELLRRQRLKRVARMLDHSS